MVTYHPPGTFRGPILAIDHTQMSALVDTNVFIYALDKNKPARMGVALAAIDALDHVDTSAMCYMEVMVGFEDQDEAQITAAELMFSQFKILPILNPIEALAVAIRRRRLGQARAYAAKSGGPTPATAKLPDAIIHATALIHGLPILTNNPGDFKEVDADILAKFGVVNVSARLYPIMPRN